MRMALVSGFMLLSISNLATAAQASTVLHVPLFVEIEGGVQPNPTYTYVPVAEMNKTLVAKGQPAQLESVDLTADTKFDGIKTADSLTSALQAAGIDHAQAANELVPAAYKKGDIRTCYTGDGNRVVDIVQANTDNLYSDQFTLLGWKLGSKTVYANDIDASDKEATAALSDGSKLWKFYSKTSDAVLILASVGDDGTDVQESYIPHCK